MPSSPLGIIMRRSLLFSFFMIVFATMLAAHPHVFVENHVTVVFDEQGLTGFALEWVFDDIASAGFILDYDTNRDGKFSVQEAAVMKKEAFDNLRNYGYMTDITIDDQPFKVQFVKDFRPAIIDGLLAYRFTIPCHVTAIATPKRITIAVYDQEYFIDFSLIKDKIRLKSPRSIAASHRVTTSHTKSFYFEQMNPDELRIEFHKK
jgi:ABC-type uncharacterized transport system substrate-binding protein